MTASGRPRRVLHVGKYFPPVHGGMEVFLRDLVHAQRMAGEDARVLVHGQPQPGDPEWLTRIPVQFELVFAPIAAGFRRALARLLAEFQPDILHLHMPNNSVFWALTLDAARRVPWVVHWHSDVVVSSSRKLLAFAYRVYRPFEQAVLERAERIIVTSPPYLEASEPLERWRDKCLVVPLGLAHAGPQEPAAQTPSLLWNDKRLRLLSIGRLTYYKGFETLIRAAAALPDVQLVIAGDGELRDSLGALVRSSTPAGQPPAVVLRGEVSDQEKQALLQSCDVFCLASCERTEAFGLVVLEALQNGKPCLVSALHGSGLPWIVQQCGAGWLVPTGDVAGWRRAIMHCADQPQERRQRGLAAQQAAQVRFGIGACAQGVSRAYATCTEAPVGAGDRVLIVIPARDEAGTIGNVLAPLRAAGWTDVLVVDDHSTDGTAEVVRAAGVQVLQPVLPTGAWGAMQTGIRYAVAKGYRAVVTMDADGQHEVGELPLLLAASGQADLVIGAYPERASTARRIAWQWFRQLAGFELRDLTSGFRYYSRDAMLILASHEATLLDYQDLGTLIMLRRAGLRIVEVPVAMNLRAVGKSRIFNSWLSVGRYMVITTLLCLARLQVRRGSQGR